MGAPKRKRRPPGCRTPQACVSGGRMPETRYGSLATPEQLLHLGVRTFRASPLVHACSPVPSSVLTPAGACVASRDPPRRPHARGPGGLDRAQREALIHRRQVCVLCHGGGRNRAWSAAAQRRCAAATRCALTGVRSPVPYRCCPLCQLRCLAGGLSARYNTKAEAWRKVQELCGPGARRARRARNLYFEKRVGRLPQKSA